MLDREILLLDVVDGLPQGEAMDINHMLSERGVDVTIRGSNDYSDMEGSDVVVVVAGSGRKPGMTRMDLLKINAGIVKSVVSNIAKFAPDSIIIPVTNPLDPMVYITHKVSGFERNRVFGMGGMLDASRFRQFIHEATGHSRNSIRAMVIGEHGEHMLPLTRYSSVSGIPLCSFVPQPKLDAMVKNTREVALKVIQTKGATVHAPGNAIASMIEAVVKDQKQLIPVSTYLDGEYGYHDLVLGVPAVIGRRGVESIMDLDLNDSERRTMDAAAESVRTAVASLDI
ncbi:Malate dehydrogenase [Geodia barretti]|uniref:L-lactate dehydrogenase n=1 Tax=Geodia barretti TaxID=519541 RepID=A0AA35T2P3_GEOBA|nr:Malate dehydrogenase [Geodia barretti]